jgi:hypothetical protein
MPTARAAPRGSPCLPPRPMSGSRRSGAGAESCEVRRRSSTTTAPSASGRTGLSTVAASQSRRVQASVRPYAVLDSYRPWPWGRTRLSTVAPAVRAALLGSPTVARRSPVPPYSPGLSAFLGRVSCRRREQGGLRRQGRPPACVSSEEAAGEARTTSGSYRRRARVARSARRIERQGRREPSRAAPHLAGPPPGVVRGPSARRAPSSESPWRHRTAGWSSARRAARSRCRRTPAASTA